MDSETHDMSDDQVFRAYLEGIAGILPPRKEDALILHTAHAMGVISRERGAITSMAAVVETAQRILTGPAAEIELITPAAPGDEFKLITPRSPATRSPQAKARAPKGKPVVSPQTSALRRAAGTKPVPCPVPGCQGPGIRSKKNFCTDHAGALSAEERQRLRTAQRASHVAESVGTP